MRKRERRRQCWCATNEDGGVLFRVWEFRIRREYEFELHRTRLAWPEKRSVSLRKKGRLPRVGAWIEREWDLSRVLSDADLCSHRQRMAVVCEYVSIVLC